MKRGPLVAALAGAGVVILTVVGLILPKAGQVRTREQDVARAATEERNLRLDLQLLEQAALDAPGDRQRLADLEGQVPPTADLPGLIRLVNTAAAQSDVDFMAMAPSTPFASGSGISSIPTQITVTGGFFAIDQFLYRLETLPRVSKVLSITVTPGPAGPPQLQAVLATEFYTTDTSAGPGSVPGPSEPSVDELFDEAGRPVDPTAPPANAGG